MLFINVKLGNTAPITMPHDVLQCAVKESQGCGMF